MNFKLRSDLMYLVRVARLQKINFFCGIPKIGFLLLAKRGFIEDAHGASTGEANLLFAAR